VAHRAEIERHKVVAASHPTEIHRRLVLQDCSIGPQLVIDEVPQWTAPVHINQPTLEFMDAENL